MCEFILKTIIEIVIVGGTVTLGIGFLLSRYERKKAHREKSILIAELLSKWSSNPNDRTKLNQLTWEASILLPKDLLKKLNQCLTHDKNAPSTFDLINEARKTILGDKEAIKGSDITWFPFQKEEKTK